MTAYRLASSPRWSSTTWHITGIALQFVALGMLFCSFLELNDGGSIVPLLAAGLFTLAVGTVARLSTETGKTGQAEIFAAVGGTWLIVSVFGALPYLLAATFARPGIGFPVEVADALFESISGVSCTGSTVFGAHNPIESQGAGILFYRQLTQWMGGMGIVVLVVSILPSLRASGLGLMSAEAPGTGSADRLAPRVTDTAQRFWKLYFVFTAVVAGALLFAGMSVFDAVAHALTTASTGGFSTRDASIGYWDSANIETVLIAGMIFGGANFTLHWRSFNKKKIVHFSDPEFRGYLFMLTAASAAVIWILFANGLTFGRSVRAAVFNVVTLGTSTGFGNATSTMSDGNFVLWAGGAQVILLILLVFGGCTGSTSGGVKVLRLQVGLAHARRSLRSFRQPRAVFPVFLGRRPIPDSLVERIAGFMVIYAMLVVGGTFVLAALGTDLLTAASGGVSSLGNMGPALQNAGPTASFVDGYSAPARLVLAFMMLVGRLEIFPMVLMMVAPYRTLRHRLPRL